MKCTDALIIENVKLNEDVLRMKLKTDIAPLVRCGQFVQVQVPGFFLRRPISVCCTEGDTLTLVYKVVGQGTDAMAQMKPQQTVSLIGPLGTGFPLLDRDVTLIGGGVGVPPLVETAKQYRSRGFHVTCVLGFNRSADMILVNEMKELGSEVETATMDGSYGVRGTVIDAIREKGIAVDMVLACGPLPMLKAVCECASDGYVSLESRMACGFGACMGCVVKTPEGESRRVCTEGPVFRIGEVVL